MFSVPYYGPRFSLGKQIYAPGPGGQLDYSPVVAATPHPWPTVYNVQTYGLGAPLQMPTMLSAPSRVNTYNPPRWNALFIPGLIKPGIGG